MTATVDGKTLLSCRITERLDGAWLARVQADSQEQLAGQVTIDVDGVEFVGTVTPTAGVQDGRSSAVVLAGAGGIGKVLSRSLAYANGVRLRTIVEDIARQCGETLSDDSDQALLATQVPQYVVPMMTGARALTELCKRYSGSRWRILRDGTLWIGRETWEAIEVDPEQLIDDDFSDGTMSHAPESPNVLPGQSIDGRDVVEVVTTTDGRSLTQVVSFEGHAPPDPMTARIDDRISRQLDYTRMYSAEVRGQNGGTVDVLPDDARVRGVGITQVQLRHGIPGLTVQVATGSRVLVGFENADPTRPYAALWPDGSSVQGIQFGDGTSAIALEGLLANYFDALFNAISSAQLTAPSGGGPVPCAPLAVALQGVGRNIGSSLLTSD